MVGDLTSEDQEDVVGKNDEIEEKNKKEPDPCDDKILQYAKHGNAQCGNNVFHDDEVDISIANEQIHERVDFPSPFLNMEDRKVGIQNGKRDDEDKRDKKVTVIAVDIQIGLPIRFPPNGLTASVEGVSAE
jgi:hypothetical protein